MGNSFLGAFLGVTAIMFARSFLAIASRQDPTTFYSSPNADIVHALYLGCGAIVGCLIGLARTIERAGRRGTGE